jgi:dihydrodipicolinate synthase/N-acetylneuraminate lyase
MPALLTPFDDAGELHLAAHRHNLQHLSAIGVEGFLIAGSTGEGPYLDSGERQRLVEAARDTLGESVYLACGVAAESVRSAAAQIGEAAAGGADAVFVATPTTLARGDHDAVVRFYVHVAEASSLPGFLYSVPRVTGYELPVEQVAALATHPNIVGIKDSGGRPVRIQDLARTVNEPFIMFGGSSRTLAPSMAAGGYGAITASANYAAPLVIGIVSSAASSQAEAERLQVELTALVQVVEAHGLAGTKAAAVARGLQPGWPRLPLAPLSEDQAANVRAFVTAALGSSPNLRS